MENSAVAVNDPAAAFKVMPLMIPYENNQGNSGVSAYRIAKDSITIRFQDGGTYIYSYASPGKTHVEKMKKLAVRGAGLATYINSHVRSEYAQKIA